MWTTSGLPASAKSIYATATNTTVALIPFGAGKIAFLAYDWFDAVPVGSQDGGWLQVLNSAVNEVANRPPTAIAGGPYSVAEGGSVLLVGSGSDPNGDPLSYEWDFDYDGTTFNVEATGASVNFSAALLDGPTTQIVALRVSDGKGGTHIDTAIVEVQNVAPQLQNITITPSINENDFATLSGDIIDPGVLDTFTLTINWGDPLSPNNIETIDLANPPAHVTWNSVTRQFSIPHQYLDDNPSGATSAIYNLSVTVADDDGAIATLGYLPQLVNFSFETGDYTGWTLQEIPSSAVSAGTWGIAAGGQAVNPGQSTFDFFDGIFVAQFSPGLPHTYTATDGGFLAYQLQNGPQRHRMSQDITLGAGTTNLTWDMEYRNHNGSFNPNQFLAVHVRDLADNILQTLFITTQGVDPQTVGSMTTFSRNISAFAGQTVRLDVELNVQSFYFDAAFDNFRIEGASGPQILVNNVAPMFEAGPNETLNASMAGAFARNGITFTDPGTLDVHTLSVDFGDGTGNQTFTLPVGDRSFNLNHTFATEGTFTVSVTVQDDDLGSRTDTFDVTVELNTPPIAHAGGPYTVSEGSSIQLDASGSFDNEQANNNTLTYEWDLDYDGLTFTVDTTGIQPTVSFPDDFAHRTIAVRVTDDGGLSSIATTTLEVTNVAPQLQNVTITSPINENAFAVLTGDIIDPGVLDTFTIIVDWGDGSPLETFNYPAGTTSFEETRQYLDDGPSGTPSHTYVVTVTVFDNDMGGTSTGYEPTLYYGGPGVSTSGFSTSTSVGAVHPDGTNDGTVIASAGFVTDFEVDLDGGKIYWGDATNPGGTNRLYRANLDGSDQEVLATVSSGVRGLALDLAAGHIYFASVQGLYRVNLDGSNLILLRTGTFSLLDIHDDKLYWSAFTTIQRSNLDGTTQELLISGQSSITGIHVAGDLGKIFWSDQSSGLVRSTALDGTSLTTIAASQQGARGIAVDPASGRVYWGQHGNVRSSRLDGSDFQSFQVGASILSLYFVEGSSPQVLDGHSVSVSLVVNNVAPVLTGVSLNQTVIDEDGSVTLSGSFTDVGTLDTHTVEITWGDGTTSLATVDAVNRTFTASHHYLDDGANPGNGVSSHVYTIGVKVTDDDGGVAENTSAATVTVNNVAPVLGTVSLDHTVINENGSITLSGSFTDVGTLDTHTVLITWGDGTTSLATVDAVTRTFTASHQYLDDGPNPGNGVSSHHYTIGVTVTDDDGGISIHNLNPFTNGSFETGDFTGWNVSIASGGAATVVTSHNAQPDGTPVYGAVDGSYFALLRGGAANEYTSISQSITVAAGQTISGFAFYDTQDYVPFLDDSRVILLMSGPTVVATLFSANTSTTGDYGQTPWAPWSFTFTTGGTYTLEAGVRNTSDSSLSPFLGFDFALGQGLAVTVNNVAPVLAPVSLDKTVISENGSITLSGSFTDVGGLDTHTVEIAWGDGTTSQATVNAVNRTFTASHQYLDDGPNPGNGVSSHVYTIGVKVTDDDGGVAENTSAATVTVNNVAPVLGTVSLDKTVINENGSITLSGSFTDVGTLDTHTVVITWGDGTTSQATVNAANRTFTASHQYLDDGPDPGNGVSLHHYTIGVKVTDDDGGVAENVNAATVTVNNVAPVLDAVSLSQTVINENGSITLSGSFTDVGALDTHTVVITWGDGTTSQATVNAVNRTFTASHQYLDDGPNPGNGVLSHVYTIGVKVTDDDGGVAENVSAATVTVNNVAPVLGAVSLSQTVINENGSITLSGSFTDVGALDTHTVVITWGDGTTSQATVNAANRTFTASHQYLDDGPDPGNGVSSHLYTIGVKVTDDDGGVAQNLNAATVTVNNINPAVSGLTGPVAGVQQQSTSLSGVRGQMLVFTSSYSDVGTLDTHEVQWDFGDGTVSAFEAHAVGDVLATHTYAASGTYTVTLSVRDDDGGLTTVSSTVTIVAAQLQTDSCDPTKTQLVVGGTSGDDIIRFTPVGNSGAVQVMINGVLQGTFAPTGKIVAYGQAGDDDIQVAGGVNSTAWLFGGEGNDRLKGGGGDNFLDGGEGDDHLVGGNGRNVLVGGNGNDRLVGGSKDDILIAGWLNFDPLKLNHAICAIMAEWTSGRSYQDRVKNLTGGEGLDAHADFANRANHDYFLRIGQTVIEDDSQDKLTGAAGKDWFFFDKEDDIATDLKDEVFANDLSWVLPD